MCKQYFVMRVSSQRIREKINKQQEIEKEFQQNFLRQKFVFESAGYTLTEENTIEDRITGGSKAEERPNFSKLLDIIEAGSTIYFVSVDRFSRDYKAGMEMIDMLLYDKKVNIVFVGDNKVLYADKRFDATEWFTISMLLLTAEYQKRCIGQMTSQKLQAMKADGIQLGRRPNKLSATELEIANLYQAGGVTMQELADRYGLADKSRVSRILAKYKKEKGESNE